LNKPLKIFHLITSLQGGGSENYLHQLLSGAPPGLHQEVLYLKEDGVIGGRIRRLGVAVRKVSPMGLWKILREEKPQILHTNLYRAHQVGRLIGRRAGVPVILSSQQAIDAWQKPWHRFLDRITLRCCDAVLVNSNAAAKLIESRRGKRPAPRIFKIENGVDTSRFVRSDGGAARKKFHLPENAVAAGALLRLHPEKGADLIPDLAARVLTRWPRLHLLVGGVGPLEASLRVRTQGRPWAPRLHWLGWLEETAEFLSALDFAWSVSREESFPQFLLEASVMGLPWTAPEVGGIPELIDAGAPGLLYPVGRLDEAAARFAELLQELPRRKAASMASAEALRPRYSQKRMADSFYSLIDEVGSVYAHSI